jgi:hypothetical protein
VVYVLKTHLLEYVHLEDPITYMYPLEAARSKHFISLACSCPFFLCIHHLTTVESSYCTRTVAPVYAASSSGKCCDGETLRRSGSGLFDGTVHVQ